MLLSSKVRYHLLKMELRQTHKIMENQGGANKNRNNTFSFHGPIHFIGDLIGPLYIFIFYRATSLVGSRGKAPKAPIISTYLKPENS